jgi:hypothetical protein
MKTLILFVAFLFITSNSFASRSLVIKGTIKHMAVGEGLSCGSTSQAKDFKTILMVINSKDTLRTTANDNMEFEFSAIRESDVFYLIFPYKNANTYLNRNLHFIPKDKQTVKTLALHRDEMNCPQLSDYETRVFKNSIELYLTYGLYCFLNSPYEPAGLKLYDFPLQEASYMHLQFPMQIDFSTKDQVKGIATVYPKFGFQLVNEKIQPVYVGFAFKQANFENENGKCHNGEVNSPGFPCNVMHLIQDIHSELAAKNASYQQKILGKNGANFYFEHPTLLRIDNLNPLEKVEVYEPPTVLIFKVQNLTKKNLYFKAEGVSEKFAAGIQSDFVEIKRDKTETVIEIKFSMNNPKNYNAKIWLNTFPNEFLSDYGIYVGKKRIKIPIDKKWVVESSELKQVYTLIIGL